MDSKDYQGMTPQSYAAREGHTEIVKLMLEYGSIDVDSRCTFNQTPLSLASEAGHAAIVIIGERGYRCELEER